VRHPHGRHPLDQYTDPETGLQYLRARYYDPATGQFLTRDPAEASTRDSYGYAARTPLNASDPSGMIDLPFSVPDWVPIVGGSDCVRINDDNCQRNPNNQQGTDFAGGVLNGITLGHGRGVIDNLSLTAGKVDYCDDWFGRGTTVGFTIDAAAVVAAAAPTAAPVVLDGVTAVGASRPLSFAVGCTARCRRHGVNSNAELRSPHRRRGCQSRFACSIGTSAAGNGLP